MIVANVVPTLFVETTVTKKVAGTTAASAVGTILRARVNLTRLVRTAIPTIIV